MATIPSGFPSSENTGVPAGTQLSVYTGPMTITQDGTVIDGKIINGTLRILADNVVIKNSQVNFNGYWGIDAEGAKNFTVQDSDITGPGYSGYVVSAILGSGTFLRNDISKAQNGIQLTDGASIVKGNYIHDLQSGDTQAHYDGISVQGRQSNVVIEGNTVESRDTSAVFIKNDFGPIDNVKVVGNYLFGGAGYQIYVDGRAAGGAITNVTISGNYVEKGGYGYYSIDNSSPVLTGNIQLAEGQLPPAISNPTTPTVPTVPTNPTTPTTPTNPTTPTTPTDPTDSGGNPTKGGTFYGTNGHDQIKGTAGADTMHGKNGNDTYWVNHSSDKIVENYGRGSGIDTVKSTVSFSLSGANVKGSVENLDLLNSGSINGTGNNLGNKIVGNAGDNIISGKGGNDVLTGGAGKDTFVFDTLPNARCNKDTITDFDPRHDTIAIENAIFSKIGAAGLLSADAFHIGTGAHDASDRIIYNNKTGALIYDSNGSAAGGAVQFATLSPNLSLTHDDFRVI